MVDWQAEFIRASSTPSDIQGHVALLADLAEQSPRGVVELGVRTGVSTRALIAGLARHAGDPKPPLWSYDLRPAPPTLAEIARAAAVPWAFRQLDTRQTPPCPDCDLLFIDTLHTAEQLSAELELHAPQAHRWIALHDTITFGERGERPNTAGLRASLERFLATHAEWVVAESFVHSHGLTVLQRSPARRRHS